MPEKCMHILNHTFTEDSSDKLYLHGTPMFLKYIPRTFNTDPKFVLSFMISNSKTGLNYGGN